MSILSNWFRKESTKVIFKAAVQILKALAFGVGKRLWLVVQDEVRRVESQPFSGPEKARLVAQAVKNAFPGIKDYVTNLAIELAVAHLKESLLKK